MDSEELTQHAGELFAGRYRIKRLLGNGGMGRVYLAEDTMLGDEQIALKILHPELCSDQKHVQRFLREVQLTRKITHPNIVRTFDVGTFDEKLFFTMEFADGVTLKEKAAHSKIPAYEAAGIVAEIAKGLSVIHKSGIVHRDLKPGNVMLEKSGCVKIADFGVARPGRSDMTGHNEIVGSSAYMAPEVWLGKEITSAADIYSLGVLAYEIITGALPFEGESPAEVMCKHLEGRVRPPIDVVADTPLWLSGLVLKMLEKDPTRRPASAEEVTEFISEKLRRKDSSAVPVDAPPAAEPELFAALQRERDNHLRAKEDKDSESDAGESEGLHSAVRTYKNKSFVNTLNSSTLAAPGKNARNINLGVVRQRSNLRQTTAPSTSYQKSSARKTPSTRSAAAHFFALVRPIIVLGAAGLCMAFLGQAFSLSAKPALAASTSGSIVPLLMTLLLTMGYTTLPIAFVFSMFLPLRRVFQASLNLVFWSLFLLLASIICYASLVLYHAASLQMQFDAKRALMGIQEAAAHLIEAAWLAPQLHSDAPLIASSLIGANGTVAALASVLPYCIVVGFGVTLGVLSSKFLRGSSERGGPDIRIISIVAASAIVPFCVERAMGMDLGALIGSTPILPVRIAVGQFSLLLAPPSVAGILINWVIVCSTFAVLRKKRKASQ